MNLEEVWRIREEEIYPTLFGAKRRGIFALDASLFKKKFRQKNNRSEMDAVRRV